MSKRSSLFLTVFLLSACWIGFVVPHEDHGAGSCDSNRDVRIQAIYRPGLVTLDGHADDWADVDGFEFSLLPALDPDAENAYKDGKMTVKALHDGRDVFFLLQVDGVYAYSKGEKEGEDDREEGEVKEKEGDDDEDDDEDADDDGGRKERPIRCGFDRESNKCPSVALMFQVGENATYHNMGGCGESRDTCTSKTCRGHEVDIMHFSIGSAIPGRLYGGNPADTKNGSDRYGHLVDLYAWTPHCRFLDGTSPSGDDTSAQNNWKGAWWHDTLNVHSGFVEDDSPFIQIGQKGTYTFEFSRSLRTMDRLQQDVQFTIGQSSKIAVAFWYPVDGNPWRGSQHYSINCDWLALDIPMTSSSLARADFKSSWDSATAFSLLLSVLAFCLSIFIGYWASRSKPFTPIDHL